MAILKNILEKLTGLEQSNSNYTLLKAVFEDALFQAAAGKGHKRHANNEPYEEQPIMWIERYFKSFQLGQAVKKLHESQRLPTEQAIKELHGAINYLAAHVIYLEKYNDNSK